MGYIKTPEHIKKIADAQRGRHFSDERKRNISEAQKKLYTEHPERHGRFGKKHSEETKLKISFSRKGKCVGKDNYWYRKPMSDERKQLLKIIYTGKRLSDETKKKMSLIQKDRALLETPEQRKRRGDSRRGKPLSREHREKIGKAQLGKRRTDLRMLEITGGLNLSQTLEWRRRYGKEYYQRHIERIRKRKREQMYKNREKYLESKRRYQLKHKIEVFSHYGGNPPRCKCCGEQDIIFLTIDHINGSGRKQKREWETKGGYAFYSKLRQLGYPEGFQVLCYNCNCGRAKNGGICPHEKNKEIKEIAA